LILTAARSGEVIGARWSEIDLAAGRWIIPGERMKSGSEHRVPLAARAIEILEQMPDGENVFAVSATTLAKLLRTMGHGDVTVHGFRSSFSDWAAEHTNYPHHLVEAALAHAEGDKVAAAYQGRARLPRSAEPARARHGDHRRRGPTNRPRQFVPNR
jgi:integrase